MRRRVWLLVGISGADDHLDRLLIHRVQKPRAGSDSIWALAFARRPEDPVTAEHEVAAWKRRNVWLEHVSQFSDILKWIVTAVGGK
jgi:hypothetical protein